MNTGSVCSFFPERRFTVGFFRALIQTKDLVFSTLGFFPDFAWFSAFSPTLLTVISKKTKCLSFTHFLVWFLCGFTNPSKCLVFFRLVTFDM